MSDCANVEIRELLPERLHDALDAEARTFVDAHLASCEDCATEYAILRAARAAMRAGAVPAVNTTAIVAALPRPSQSRPSTVVVRRNRMAWRIAAAVSVISLGGISFATMRRVGGAEGATASLTAAPGSASVATESTTAMVTPSIPTAASPATATTAPSMRRGLSMGGSLADLGDAQLESLLGDLDKIEAAPVAEPEAIAGSKLVSATGTGSEE